MTYLHDYVTARETIRDKVIPKLIAALMPTLDRMGTTYEMSREGRPATGDGPIDALIITMPDGTLPDGYLLRIDFAPVSTAPWKAPDGTPTKGPGF